jgi:hypothetical protein
MFVVTCPMREDKLAYALETHGRRIGVRKIASSVAQDAVAGLMDSLYPSRPSPTDPWLRVWSDAN